MAAVNELRHAEMYLRMPSCHACPDRIAQEDVGVEEYSDRSFAAKSALCSVPTDPISRVQAL